MRKHGDTKTKKSRRILELPTQAAEALRKHHTRQAAQRLSAELWEDNNLVFCTGIGTALDPARRLTLGVTVLRAPTACWWARMIVESTFTFQVIGPAESARVVHRSAPATGSHR
ncbi:hypothetical protein ABZ914_13945 [Spirillospora sp. NPDC046719]